MRRLRFIALVLVAAERCGYALRMGSDLDGFNEEHQVVEHSSWTDPPKAKAKAKGKAKRGGGKQSVEPSLAYEPVSTKALKSKAGFNATIFATRAPAVKVHLVSSGASNMYIIEGPKTLIIFDVGFGEEPAFRRYADSLGKPISRVILSNAGPDHSLGLVDFPEVETYSSKGVLKKLAHGSPKNVSWVPKETVLPGKTYLSVEYWRTLAPTAGLPHPGKDRKYPMPTKVLPRRKETVDGIKFEYLVFTDCQEAEQVVVFLPSAGVLFVGDVATLGMPMIYPNSERGGAPRWIEALEKLDSLGGVAAVFPGRGSPFGPKGLGDCLEVVARTNMALRKHMPMSPKNGCAYAAEMRKMFKDKPEGFVSPVILNLHLQYNYGIPLTKCESEQ